MKSKVQLIIFILFSVVTVVFSQELRLSVSGKPLDKVLAELGVEISFNSKELEKYSITENKTFQTPEDAIRYLLKNKPFKYDKIGAVYVISPQTFSTQTTVNEYQFSGFLIDDDNGEQLPYGYIITSQNAISTNNKGYFSFVSNENPHIQIKAQYIGYYPLDTIVKSGKHYLRLKPRTHTIAEITITSYQDLMMMQSGQRSGENRINHHIAQYMPGSNDNSVFTLLRMMPGVRMSNEPSEELIVWGENSRVTFDGITLFGMRGFNHNIGYVNPYMVKDIRLMKGGYTSSYGNQTGAIAEITGNEGNKTKPTFKTNIGTLTANIYSSIPVSKQSVLSLAYRQTFYNLYSSELFNPYNGKRQSTTMNKGNTTQGKPQQNQSTIYITPTYAFRDMNLKYAGTTQYENNYYISLYGAIDKFDYTVQPDKETDLSAAQKSKQYGAAAGIDKIWKNNATSNLQLRFSQLNNEEQQITITPSGQKNPEINKFDHSVKELGAKITHNQTFGKQHKIEAGGELTAYSIHINKEKDSQVIPSLFITENLNIRNFTLEAGIRADLANNTPFIQPRIALRQKLSNRLTITGSWGIYNQYLDHIPVEIKKDLLTFAWKLTAPSRSMHTITGIAYNNNGFLASLEGYTKQIKNAYKLVEGNIKTTDLHLWGMDLFLKKNIQNASFFGSYTFMRTFYPITETAHELKIGGLYTLKHFVFSANYLYGAGFSTLYSGGSNTGQMHGQGQGMNTINQDKPYSRLDIAATYRHHFKTYKVQSGISLVNLFDTQNTKNSYTTTSKKNPITVYSQSLPFTPMIFAEIIF